MQEISSDDLKHAREKAATLSYRTIEGSSQFHVLIFKPGSNTFRAAPYLCVCNQCLNVEYGSCKVFNDYFLVTSHVKKSVLRSNDNIPGSVSVNIECDDNIPDNDVIMESNNFCTPGSICAIAANYNSTETVWFVKVLSEQVTKTSVSDAYGHTIGPNQRFLSCLMLEKHYEHKNGFEYYVPKNASETLIFLESIVYPYVNMLTDFKGDKNRFFLLNSDYTDILLYVENNNMTSIG